MFNSKKLLFSSECAAAFCARAGFEIPTTPNATSARTGYLHTARMFFTFPSDSFVACNNSVLIPLGNSSLRQIENQSSPRSAEREDPPWKIGCEPQHPYGSAPQAVVGKRLPRIAAIHGAIDVAVLDQECFASLRRVEANRVYRSRRNTFRHKLPMYAFVSRLQNAARSCSKNCNIAVGGQGDVVNVVPVGQ